MIILGSLLFDMESSCGKELDVAERVRMQICSWGKKRRLRRVYQDFIDNIAVSQYCHSRRPPLVLVVTILGQSKRAVAGTSRELEGHMSVDKAAILLTGSLDWV